MQTVGRVSMEGPKEKLLGTYSSEPYMQDFKKLLAERLKTEMDPINVVLAVNLLAGDLAKGRDGFTGQPFKDEYGRVPRIVGLDRSMYQMLGYILVQHGDEYFGKEFAEEMRREWKEAGQEASALAALLR